MHEVTTPITKYPDNNMSVQESNRGILCADQGASGATPFTGIDISGNEELVCETEFGFTPRVIRVDGAGVVAFRTLDDNTHVVDMAAKTELRGIFIKSIFQDTYTVAALRTTATGIHLF